MYFSHAFSPPAVPADPVEAAAKSYYNSKVGVYAAVAFYLGALAHAEARLYHVRAALAASSRRGHV